MTTNEKKLDTLETGVYTIRNDMLKAYENCFSCPVQQLANFLSNLVNDVQSKFWNEETNYSVYRIGTFNEIKGILETQEPELITKLDMFIQKNKRDIQLIVQTLNFLPTGYFKMPDEMKKQIQEKIDNATVEYIDNYVVKDIEVNKKTSDEIKTI